MNEKNRDLQLFENPQVRPKCRKTQRNGFSSSASVAKARAISLHLGVWGVCLDLGYVKMTVAFGQ